MGAAPTELTLSGLVDEEGDEIVRWERFNWRARELCEPLSRMVGRKNTAWALQLSESQLSKELSGAEDKRLSLARLVVCDGAGYRMPEKVKRRIPEEENRLQRHWALGQLILNEALGRGGQK